MTERLPGALTGNCPRNPKTRILLTNHAGKGARKRPRCEDEYSGKMIIINPVIGLNIFFKKNFGSKNLSFLEGLGGFGLKIRILREKLCPKLAGKLWKPKCWSKKVKNSFQKSFF